MSKTRVSFSSHRLATAATIAGLALFVPSAAHAQGADKAAAETLFQDAKRLMSEGKYGEACPKLEESNKIDPGAGTLTALALCHRGEGKTATAWSEFKEVISLARRDNRKDREQVAEENIRELEPKLSKLTIVLDPAAKQQSVEIKLDSRAIPTAMTGSPFPADPGVHKLTVSAAGFKSRESIVEIAGEADSKSITVGPLEADGGTATKPVEATTSTTESPKQVNTTLRTTSYIVGGLGIVGLGVGIVTGLIASGKHSDANCTDDLCPNAEATEKEKDAHSMGTISTIGFVAGGVLLAGGVALNLLSTSSSKKTGSSATLSLVPSVSAQGGFGSLVGRF